MNKNVSLESISFCDTLSEIDKMLALWALSLGYLPVIGVLIMTIGK